MHFAPEQTDTFVRDTVCQFSIMNIKYTIAFPCADISSVNCCVGLFKTVPFIFHSIARTRTLPFIPGF